MKLRVKASQFGFALCLLMCMVLPVLSLAQSFTQLQVLLPGEVAAPGTPTGKLGVPQAQTVGIPFDVQLNACDADWNVVPSVTDIMEFESSNASASLPSNTSLVGGQMTAAVTFNASGSFTISVSDLSDLTIPTAISTNADALVLSGFEFSPINQKNQYAGVPLAISVSAIDAGGDVVTGFTGD